MHDNGYTYDSALLCIASLSGSTEAEMDVNELEETLIAVQEKGANIMAIVLFASVIVLTGLLAAVITSALAGVPR